MTNIDNQFTAAEQFLFLDPRVISIELKSWLVFYRFGLNNHGI